MNTQSFEFKVAFEICLLDFISSCVKSGFTIEEAKNESLAKADVILQRVQEILK